MTDILYFIYSIFSIFTLIRCQEWSWIEGENIVDVPSSGEYPGGRSGSSVWRDMHDDVWIFGGQGISVIGGGQSILLNDLWKYSTTKGQWQLVHPGTTSVTSSKDTAVSPQPRHLAAACGVTDKTFVVFGGLGKADAAFPDTWVYHVDQKQWVNVRVHENETSLQDNETVSNPSPRGDMASWCLQDKMFIFGGIDSNNKVNNELWTFSLTNLTWSEITNPENVPDKLTSGLSTKYPMARNGATTWIFNNRTLYMFGGNILSTNIRSRHLNIGYTSDLWHYNIERNMWNYVTGFRNSCVPAVYGRYQTRSINNIPGCRRRAASWTEQNGNLWMFGGDGTDSDFPTVFHTAKLLSDLWLYEVKTGMWTWFGGRNRGESDPKYFRKGESSSAALPGGRCDSMAWVGPGFKFYLFGGLGHDGKRHDGYLNDLWILYMEDVIGPVKGMAGGLLVFFILLAVSFVLAMCVIALYARDKHSLSSRRRLHFDAKYSKLTDTVE